MSSYLDSYLLFSPRSEGSFSSPSAPCTSVDTPVSSSEVSSVSSSSCAVFTLLVNSGPVSLSLSPESSLSISSEEVSWLKDEFCGQFLGRSVISFIDLRPKITRWCSCSITRNLALLLCV